MSHTHVEQHVGRSLRRLAWTLVLVLAYAGAEVVGGLVSGSLALLADAGHMLSDAAAIGLTLFAMRFARRAPSATHTFGYYRAEILAALVNGATLLGIAFFIVIEAVERFSEPIEVQAPTMLAVGAGGLLVNVVGLWLLREERNGSLNIRGAWLHVLTDALGSVQAIAAALLIWNFGWSWTDPVASILIAALVVFSSWSLLRQSVNVLMERAPGHVDVDQVWRALNALSNVREVHDLHVWSISSSFVALSAHLVVDHDTNWQRVVGEAKTQLRDQFGITHSTLQLDIDGPCGQVHHGPMHEPAESVEVR